MTIQELQDKVAAARAAWDEACAHDIAAWDAFDAAGAEDRFAAREAANAASSAAREALRIWADANDALRFARKAKSE